MAYPFGTEAWSLALREEINESSHYRESAATWGTTFNGNLLLVLEGDAETPRTERLFLQLARGECHGAEFVRDGRLPEAGFTLTGLFSVWKSILAEPAYAPSAILSGSIQVLGPKMTLLMHVASAKDLIRCFGAVPTIWEAG